MEIGIPKETKRGEFRVALIPDDARKLVEAEHTVFVERNAGTGAGFSDEEYENADAKIKDSVYDCPMIVRVKKPPLESIRKNQVMLAYLHIEKGQDPALLKRLLEQEVTAYAYEEIRDERENRLVNLGFEAGVVGMYEGFRTYGGMLDESGQDNIFKTLPPIQEIGREEVCRRLAGLHIKNQINIVLMGNGCVSEGVQNVLRRIKIRPTILGRGETPSIEDYLPAVDIIVNAVLWYPTDPQIVKRSVLKLMKKTALIIDISCDKNGAVQTCIPTTWSNPTYKVDGVTHFCIDNLPSAIPRESSIHLSRQILPHILSVTNGEGLKTGLMTWRGKFMYGSQETS